MRTFSVNKFEQFGQLAVVDGNFTCCDLFVECYLEMASALERGFRERRITFLFLVLFPLGTGSDISFIFPYGFYQGFMDPAGEVIFTGSSRLVAAASRFNSQLARSRV